MMESYKIDTNKINEEILKNWRRDIVRLNPVFKINNKKEKISLSISFENNKEKSIDNELKTTDTNHKPKAKIRSLF